ncbi:MAG: PEP-CTERM sorting domain-containing protein [Spirochaetaceae bacterium]|nr:PEP-CTERM sorting domain-containing protein [Spirochaetaceae bacterium]HPG26279.1 PEP-CTERM sorting domain-containing protein [Myxococcota bacterium]
MITTPRRFASSTHRRDAHWPRSAAALAATLLLASSPAAAQLVAQPVDYDCTIIASTDEFPDGLPGAPTINAWGRVAFHARTAPGVTEVRSGIGDVDTQGIPITQAVARAGSVADADTYFYAIDLNPPRIDDQSRIYWHGFAHGSGPPEIGVYRKDHDAALDATPDARLLVQTADPTSPILVLQPGFRVNGQGEMLFVGRRDGQAFDELLQGSSSAASPLDGGASDWASHPASQPWAAWTRFQGATQDLHLDSSTPRRSVDASTRFMHGLSLAGGEIPLVSWIEDVFDVPGTSWQLRLASPIAESVEVDDGLDTTGTFSPPEQTTVNSFGEIAISGPTGEPLLFSDGDQLIEVRCQNALELFGSFFFVDHDVSDRSINNEGQIAFRAETGLLVLPTFAEEAFIIRADPISTAHPSVCTALPDDTPCDDGDPESLAYCTAGVCTPVPEPGVLAGLLAGGLALGLLGARRTRS